MSGEIPPFDLIWFRFVVGFVIGAVLGSFGTVLAHRLPRGESIVTPRSHCPACHRTLLPRDLVPIFSYLLTRGRCRACNATIGSRYLWIEITCSITGGVIAILFA